MTRKSLSRLTRIVALALWGGILLASAARAGVPVTLAWDANPAAENVTGYVLYHGMTSRSATGFTGYDASVDVGNVTQYTVSISNPEADHYFAVVARNAEGLTSDYSAEVKRDATTATPTTWLIVASATAGGSISPAGASTVNQGANLTVAITPAAGYQIAKVTVDGTSVGTPTTYTFSSVSADHTLQATFEAVTAGTWAITTTASAGGSVLPTGTTSVNEGGELTVAISADAGYQITNVLVDGTSVGTPNTYTFPSVSANHTLQASFAPVAPSTWTITTSAGMGGSVSPVGMTTVNQGTSLAVTITPGSGYRIADILVDGGSVGTPSSYKFSSVSTNHTLQAIFAPTDSDGDLLPDAWEKQYFGNLNVSAGGDFDGDGITNRAEYLAGTDPTVPNLDASLTPVVRGPVSGGTVVELQPEISVYNPIDPEAVAGVAARAVPLTYEFEIARDSAMLQDVITVEGVAEGTGYTAWTPPENLTDQTRYYWRARTTAGEISSPWSPVCTFYLDTTGVATAATEASTAYVVAGQSTDLDVSDPASPAYLVAVDLPAGMLPYDFVATVQTIDNPPAPTTAARILGKVYEFGPTGVPLAEKAKVWLPYTDQNLADAGVMYPRELSVLTYNTESLTWEPVPIFGVDYISKRLICEVEHFSMYAVGTSDGPSGGNTSRQSQADEGSRGACFLQSLW